ncbi:MAG: Fe-S cluster assembly ATPase SufC [Magnetococcales bacterium]|nr:Fe-S cluster assembly ATPase SufC [Magnetococcales bacterium]MBF0438549.1 Fe-S cluster assembly ATPase SufC [Magnetococcales bacterium]
MLEIKELCVDFNDKNILRGVNLTIQAGEVHAIMGPNGSGKSTLVNLLAGRAGYQVTAGQVLFQGEDLLPMQPEERAKAGIFLGFQYPVEIPGISNALFMKTALNAQRRHQHLAEMEAMDFRSHTRKMAKSLGLEDGLLLRPVNVGFSGGEKKRNELFQMMILQPCLAILDEIDSGLDIDALVTVASGINALRTPQRSILMVTHYQRLLNDVVPDRVHVMMDGRIVLTGSKDLAMELEEKGYGWLAGAGQ